MFHDRDRVRLQQIASNLSSNAVKFTPEDGQVSVRLRRACGWVELIVTDSGQGIPAEFVPHVEDMRRKLKRGRKRKATSEPAPVPAAPEAP